MSSSKTSNTTLVVVTLLVLLALCVTNCVAIHTALVRVHIKNELATGGPAQDLTVGCKSRDDDLGSHVIASEGSWEFQFHPNFWPSTLIFCWFSWPSLGTEIKWFDIYIQRRDQGHCNNCCWRIISTGACLCKCTGPCKFSYNCHRWNHASLR